MIPSFLWPFIGIALIGWLLLFFLDRNGREWFPYKKRWKTAHESEDWIKVVRSRAFRRHGYRCCFTNSRVSLQGHYRRYKNRLGRRSAWRDVTTVTATAHSALPKSEALNATLEREKGNWWYWLHLPTIQGFSRLTVFLAFFRDRWKCRGCYTKLQKYGGGGYNLTLHRRTSPPPYWNWWARFRDYKNCFVWCENCLTALKYKRRSLR